MRIVPRRVTSAVTRRQIASVMEATPTPVKVVLAALLGGVVALVIAGLVYTFAVLLLLRALTGRATA